MGVDRVSLRCRSTYYLVSGMVVPSTFDPVAHHYSLIFSRHHTHHLYTSTLLNARSPKMADKLRAQQQLEALQSRYIGIGSADTTRYEWTSNMARDSLSSYVGHPPLLQYMSIGLGQPREKTRIQMLERMIQPVGPPPKVRGLLECCWL